MAEEKPFAATPSRLRRARDDGDRPSAPETVALLGVAAGAAVVCGLVRPLAALTLAALRELLDAATAAARGGGDIAGAGVHAMQSFARQYFAAFAVFGFAVTAAAVSAAALTGGIGWTVPRWQWQRLAPAAYFKRIFSRDTAEALARAAAVSTILLTILLCAVIADAGAYAHVFALPMLAAAAGGDLRTIVFRLLAAGAVFAGFETRAAIARWKRKLRMTHTEIKREYREQSGDPHLRSRRKRLHRRNLRGAKNPVRDAFVILTNPTHLAIGLRYQPPEIAVPVVTVRAADHAAARVRRQAARWDVPLIEAVDVARYLYARTAEGDSVPPESYAMIAPIIAAVLAGRTKVTP